MYYHTVSWGLPNHHMVYNICLIPKTKRTYIYKQYHENNILSVLITLQCKLIHVMTIPDNFGLKSIRTPPKNEHLNAFELVSSEFQSNLSKDIKRINEDLLLFIPADKTNNLYNLSKDNYNKLLTENITKKTNTAAINNINKEGKCIAERLHLDERVEKFNQREAFVTLKDHKENFQNNPKCRLCNPAISEIGIISKHYIKKINSHIGKTTNMNQ